MLPSEDVDIPLDLRRYIADACERLDAFDHYELLGVARDADRKTIKRAYFRLAGQLHPDRYFGKKLGSYKARLHALFGKVTLAYETLAAPDRRAAYDASLPPRARGSGAPAAPAPRPPTPSAPARGPSAAPDKRQQAMEALRQRFVEGKARAKRHAEAGARAVAAGDLQTALTEYQAALHFAPDDAELRAAHAGARRALSERSAESLRRQAHLEERYGHWTEAAESWRRVVDARPDDAQARERFAAAVARSRSNVR
jgi:curved DNA-binding protein CbpA